MSIPASADPGEDVDMSCFWPYNTNNKTVKWYRRKEKSVDAELMSEFVADRNIVQEKYRGRIIAHTQENYARNFDITLLNVAGYDSAFYWCVVTIATVPYAAEEKFMTVKSKHALISKYMN